MMRKLFSALLFLVCVAFYTTPASAFSDCKSYNFAAYYAKNLNFACTIIRTNSVDAFGRSVLIRTLRDSEDQRALQYEPFVMEAAQQSIAFFNYYVGYEALKTDDISIVIVDPSIEPPEGGFFADALESAPNECVVRIFTSYHDINANGDVLQEMRNSVAHELFHCVQFATWPKKIQVGGDADWWKEGTAELMGYLVYDNPKGFVARAKSFASVAQAKPMTQLTYDNAVFLSWLWNQNPARFFELIRAMPEQKGELSQRNALANLVGAGRLADFARDYLDGKVKTPSGNPIEPPTSFQKQSISANGDTNFDIIPFTVFVVDIDFVEGQYLITKEGQTDVSYMKLASSPRVWEYSALLSVEGDCKLKKTYRYAGMSVHGGDEERLTLKAQKLPGCEECKVHPVMDQCLVGTWKVNNLSLSGEILDNQPEALEQLVTIGFAGFNFVKSGKQYMGFKEFGVIGKPSNANGSVLFSVRLEGTIDSTWSAENGKLHTCYQDSNAGIQISVPGGEGEVIKFAEMPMNKSMNYDYVCSGSSQLYLTTEDNGKPFTIELQRVE